MKGTAQLAAKQGAGKRLPNRIHVAPQSNWHQRLAELKRFKKENGHGNVPSQSREYRQLGNWLAAVRKRKRAGKLDPKRIEQLEQAGVSWQPLEQQWQMKCEALIAYKKDHGDCNVPYRWPEDLRLSQWIESIRNRRKQNKLAQERIEQLDSIGFVWDCHGTHWESMYAALAEYRKDHGDCNVPADWPDLGWWVQWQRKSRKAHHLDRERIKRLDKLGFVWSWRGDRWEAQFTALVAFRKANGHCRVSTVSKSDPSLGRWVRKMRTKRRQGKLSAERIRQLEAIGFDWEVSTAPIHAKKRRETDRS